MRFSARLGGSHEKNALTRALEERRAGHGRILDLTQSNPTHAGIGYPQDAITRALATTRALAYDPDPRGMRSAREAVAKQQGCDAGQLLLTASTSEAYALLFKLLCDPGDAVLAPAPSYPLFDHLAALEGVRLVHYPLAWDGQWHVDFATLEAALAAEPRARVILLVNPNNPTGSFVSRGELERLESLGLPIVSDEVFADYGGEHARTDRVECVAAGARAQAAFSLGGLSKACGLPQMKLAWVHAGGPGAAEALERLDTIADAYLSVGTPVMAACEELLAAGAVVRREIRARVAGNRAWLDGRIARGGAVELLPAEGGWYALLRCPATRSDEELAVALVRDHGVLVHPGYFFDFPSGTWLVVSLLTVPDVLHAGVEAILAT